MGPSPAALIGLAFQGIVSLLFSYVAVPSSVEHGVPLHCSLKLRSPSFCLSFVIHVLPLTCFLSLSAFFLLPCSSLNVLPLVSLSVCFLLPRFSPCVLPLTSCLSCQCAPSYLVRLPMFSLLPLLSVFFLMPLSFVLAPYCSLLLSPPLSSLSWCPLQLFPLSFRRHVPLQCMAQLPLMNGLFDAPFFLIPRERRSHQPCPPTSSSLVYYGAYFTPVIYLLFYIRLSLGIFFFFCSFRVSPFIVTAPLTVYSCFPSSRSSAAHRPP